MTVDDEERLAEALRLPECGEKDAVVAAILSEHPPAEACPDTECLVCGVRACPDGEPLHFHHDGCPSRCGA